MTTEQLQGAYAKAQEVLDSLYEKYVYTHKPSITDLQLWHDGNFTVVLLNGKYMGCTKRNPQMDKYNRTTGDYWALRRAVGRLLEIEGYGTYVGGPKVKPQETRSDLVNEVTPTALP